MNITYNTHKHRNVKDVSYIKDIISKVQTSAVFLEYFIAMLHLPSSKSTKVINEKMLLAATARQRISFAIKHF